MEANKTPGPVHHGNVIVNELTTVYVCKGTPPVIDRDEIPRIHGKYFPRYMYVVFKDGSHRIFNITMDMNEVQRFEFLGRLDWKEYWLFNVANNHKIHMRHYKFVPKSIK